MHMHPVLGPILPLTENAMTGNLVADLITPTQAAFLWQEASKMQY